MTSTELKRLIDKTADALEKYSDKSRFVAMVEVRQPGLQRAARRLSYNLSVLLPPRGRAGSATCPHCSQAVTVVLSCERPGT